MGISQAQRARLGVFVIAGCVLLVVFFSIPVGRKLANRHKTYYCYFGGESLSGLEEGAEVKFRGVRIGKVARITYDPGDLSRVKATFRIRDDFPVKEDMYARAELMGITGLKYIDIMGGTNEAEALPAESIIPARASLMATITGKSEVIIEKIEILLNHLALITHPDSLAPVKNILSHVEEITREVNEFVGDLKFEITDIAASARNTMAKIDSIASNVCSITGSVSQTVDAGTLARILTRVDSTALALKTLSEAMELTIRQSREDVTVSMQNLRETLENANQLSRTLMENPSLIIKGDQQKERSFR